MTRKDYILIAAALKKALDNSRLPYTDLHAIAAAKLALENAARYLSEALGRDNPRFDPERFLRAAGVQS